MSTTPEERELFLGCIIAESLEDMAPVAGLAPVAEKVSEMPDDPDATVWHTRWYQLDQPHLERRLPALAAAMRRNWYAHFWREELLCVILPGRVFWLDAGDQAARAELIAYGETVGVGRRWTSSIPTVAPAYVQEALRKA
jgi:hypothetical protein